MMMGRSPSSDENGLKKGPWTPEEDQKLVDYIQRKGHGSWRALPKLAGLNRCGKSCRLRWTNYLRPDIKRGKFSKEEEQIIIKLHSVLGNKWSAIATRLPGRTDNEIKNHWNTHLKKKLLQMGIDPVTHRPRTDHLNLLANLPQLLGATGFLGNLPITNHWENPLKLQLLHSILQVLITAGSTSATPPNVELASSLLGLLPFQDQHKLYELLLQQNSQLIQNSTLGNFNSPNIGFSLDHSNISNQISSYFPNSNVSSEALQEPYSDNYQIMEDLKALITVNNTNGTNNYDNPFGSSSAIPSANSVPALVSASSECSAATEVKNRIDPKAISDPSSSSNTFEAWRELMDCEATDSYWREIMDQASSPPWPISS